MKGGRDAAWRVIDGVRMISITANFGDVKSTVCHPATTTHGRIPPAEREKAHNLGSSASRLLQALKGER